MSYREIIEPGRIYHLYNHANGNLLLFRAEDNYRYFMERYLHYLYPVADTFAYCLMPNHYHFMIRTREKNRLLGSEISPRMLTNAIKNWLVSYTRSYNNMYCQRGNLYCQRIRRKLITDDQYFRQLVAYIHLNPVMAGLTKFPSQWNHSSYNKLLCETNSFLAQNDLMEYFDSLENFMYYHKLRQVQKFAAKSNLIF